MDPLHINLYDDITPGVARDISAALLANPGADVVLRINSPGGNVTDGYAIANALRSHAGSKTAVIEGACASAATFPACACDEIHMHPESFFMVHGPWGEVSGKPEAMTTQADLLTKMADLCSAMYQRKSGADDAQVREWMSRDTWMTPVEAMAAGFCDKILTDAAPPMARAAAQHYMARLRPANTTKDKIKMANEDTMLPENLAAKLAKHGLASGDKSPEKTRAAYQTYLASTEDGPAERTEMAKAMAGIEQVDGPGGDNGERSDNPVTVMSAEEQEEKRKKDETERTEMAKDLPPAAQKLVAMLSRQIADRDTDIASLSARDRARSAKETAAEVAGFYAFAKTRQGVTDADAKEYLELSGQNVTRARALVAKHPEKTTAMNKITHDGRPAGATHGRASEVEAAPMSGRHQLHGYALSKVARASLPKDKPPTFAEVAKAQREVAKTRPDLWA